MKFHACKYITQSFVAQAFDEGQIATHHCPMPQEEINWKDRSPKVVGSFGDARAIEESRADEVRASCDFAEIRLDLLPIANGRLVKTSWRHLSNLPLLFTARRSEEGGGLALDAATRSSLLASVLDEASLIDIEVASIEEMSPLIATLKARNLPWIASFHDFERLPADSILQNAASQALAAGATAFKFAARLSGTADLARIADFQLGDHGIPVASMGMGPLAPVSRLLCAQSGSVLNYGYLGTVPTAPGQWDSALLKNAISRLTPFHG